MVRERSQGDFGRTSKVREVGGVERGERNVAILSLRRIAKTLRVPVAKLVG